MLSNNISNEFLFVLGREDKFERGHGVVIRKENASSRPSKMVSLK